MSQSSQDCLSQQFTQRPDGVRLRETAKIPRATCKTLQASVHMLNVKGHDTTIRKTLNKYGLF